MKINALFLAAALLLLTGCQLAQPEQATTDDRLVGALVTAEPLDLFDMEAYLQDNAAALTGGTVDVTAAEADAYQNRLYAAQDESGDFRFPGVDGALIYDAVFDTEDGPLRGAAADDRLSDCRFDYSELDDGREEIALSAGIYLVPDGRAHRIYVNPVYQDADGALYARTGDGMALQPDQLSANGTLTLSQTLTATENGAPAGGCAATVAITAAFRAPAETLTLLAYGADGELLSRSTFPGGDLPAEITAPQGAAWLVAESGWTDADGAPQTDRALYTAADESVTVWLPDGSGCCTAQTVPLRFA